MKKYSILIVDDHPLYREGLSEFINREPDLEVSAVASSESEAFDILEKTPIDLVTVDINLTNSSGLSLIRTLASKYPKIPSIALSMHSDHLYADQAISAGAKGYVNKETETKKVIDSIREALAGKIVLSPDMTQTLLQKMASGLSDNEIAIGSLSQRELEVFNMIGRGKTTAEIAENLSLSPKTVETYRANIKLKLNLENNTQLVQHATLWAN